MKLLRLFSYLCAFVFACGLAPAWAQCPPRTTVAETLYNADGTLAEGRLVIAWQTFSIGSCQVPAGQATVSVNAGALSVQLYPNITATPSGTSYRATYYLKSGRVTTEYWVVPASATPVGLAAVRSATVPVPNVMFGQSQVTNLTSDLAKKVELPAPCPSGKFLQANGSAAPPQVDCVDAPGGGGGSGTVTSVGLSAPAQFSVSGSPVTAAGTLGLAWLNQSANQIFAAPATGGAAAPAFRGLVPADLALSTRGDLLLVNSTPALARLAIGASGTFLRSNGADPLWQAITAGDIPSLDASKITTGSFADSRVDDSITLTNLAQITTRNYSDLQNVPSAFTPAAHALDGAAHTVSGLTTGHYLRANSATTFAFAPIAFNELTGNVTDAQVPNNITVDLAAAATALAANGSNCTNQFPRGVDAAGAAEGCATVAKADAAATFVHTDQANTYSAGFKQTFAPNGTSAGLNLGSVSGDPSTLTNGDVWYDSAGSKFRCREGGTSKDCIGAGGSGVPNPAANGIVACTGTNCSTSAARTITGSNAVTVANGDGVSGDPTLDVSQTVFQQFGNTSAPMHRTTICAPTNSGFGCIHDTLTHGGTTQTTVSASGPEPRQSNSASGASSGNDYGWSTANEYRHDRTSGERRDPYLWARVSIEETTATRFWICLTDQTISTMAGIDNPAGNYACFRFATTASDTTWRCVTKDNTTQNVVDSTITVTASQLLYLEIIFSDATPSVTFKIDGTSRCSSPITSNLPSDGTNMKVVVGGETTAAGAKNVRSAGIKVVTKEP